MLKEPHHRKSARYSDHVMGLTILGLIPNNDKKFFPSPKCQVQLWSPPTLLLNAHDVLSLSGCLRQVKIYEI